MPPASAAETAGDDLDLSFAAEAVADPDLAAAMAELDALDEQTLDLDQALSELDQSLAPGALQQFRVIVGF